MDFGLGLDNRLAVDRVKPKNSIGPPPKKNEEFQNDPSLVKGHGVRTCTSLTLIDTCRFPLLNGLWVIDNLGLNHLELPPCP